MDEQLYHTGVLGMKWGHRKAEVAGMRATEKAGGDSVRTQKIQKKIDKKIEIAKSWETGLKDEKGRTIISDSAAKDIQKQALNGAKKLEVKLIKSKYADEYTRGLSTVGKVLNKITAADMTYGTVMYNLRNET